MALNRKKIYILACSSLPGFSREDLKRQLPELRIISDLELVEFSNKPAAENTPEDWKELAKFIFQHQDQCGGFVIVSGLDNILFASAALSFMLTNLSCPVIFTGGSGFFEDDKKMEVRANLINSMQISKSGINEVCLMFGNRLLRANQANFSQDVSLNVFSAPEKSILGRIDFSVRVNELYQSFRGAKVKMVLDLFALVHVLDLPLSPDFDFDLSGCKAMIINAKNQQQLSEKFFEKIDEIGKKKPVIIYSTKSGQEIKVPENTLLIKNMTFESTVAKFMWILSQTDQLGKIKDLMAKNIAGEILE